VSSHSVKLHQRLKDFKAIQKSLSYSVKNEYNMGVYNGLEMAWSLLNNKKPVYMVKENGKRTYALEQIKREDDE